MKFKLKEFGPKGSVKFGDPKEWERATRTEEDEILLQSELERYKMAWKNAKDTPEISGSCGGEYRCDGDQSQLIDWKGIEKKYGIGALDEEKEG